MILALTAFVASAQDEPQAALARALELADLYNWAGAGPHFKQAEQGFRRIGDDRNALMAHLGTIRANVEQDQRGLPAVSAELASALESNELLRSDRRLRLFALVVKGDIDTEVETASMKADWSEVLALATELGDEKWRYRAEAQLGLAAFYEADIQTARSNVSAAVTAAHKSGDLGALVRYLSATGLGMVETGNAAEALPYFEQALKLAQAAPDSGYPFFTQESKMAALLSVNRIGEAEALAREVLERARAGSRRSHEVHALRTLAGVQIAKGNGAEALQLLDEAIAIAEPAGLLRILADVLTMKAGVLLKAGRLGPAQVAAEAAARASQESGDLWSSPRRYQLIGDIQRQQGLFAAAHETYQTGEEFIDALIVDRGIKRQQFRRR